MLTYVTDIFGRQFPLRIFGLIDALGQYLASNCAMLTYFALGLIQ